MTQSELFDQAMRHFHQRELEEALRLLKEASEGPSQEIAVAARHYCQMCETRLKDEPREPKTADELYTLAIAYTNQRRLDEAEKNLRKALQLSPEADHLYYGLALVAGLRGEVRQAASHLQKAIELRPENRVAAVNDPDFANIAHQAPVKELLYPDSDHPTMT